MEAKAFLSLLGRVYTVKGTRLKGNKELLGAIAPTKEGQARITGSLDSGDSKGEGETQRTEERDWR